MPSNAHTTSNGSRKRRRRRDTPTRTANSTAVQAGCRLRGSLLLGAMLCAPTSNAFVAVSSPCSSSSLGLQPAIAAAGSSSSRLYRLARHRRGTPRTSTSNSRLSAIQKPSLKFERYNDTNQNAAKQKKKRKQRLHHTATPEPTNPTTANQDSIPQFARDITTVLKELRSDGTDPSLPKLFRNINMPSFTNIWSMKDWELHTSRWRYLKYFLALPTSRLLRRLAPQLTILVVWSCVACWICSTQRHVGGLVSRAVLPLAPLSLVSTFVAALLTLRSNQGLSRLNEGRLAFGKVVLYTRDMAQLIATVIYPRHPQLGLLAARHTTLFGWLLKDFLRHYDEDYTRPLQPYQPEVCHDQDIVTTMLPVFGPTSSSTAMSVDATFILQQRKKPVATVTRLRQIFAYMQDEVGMTTSEQSRLDACAQQLNKCIMICERIRSSPIPPLYTAHAGRLLVFYLCFLPLALRGSCLLNNAGTILTTTVVGYAMLGLDEISHILEEPFRLMPLYHLSKNSMKDCADAFVNMPPPLPVELEEDDDEEDDDEEEEEDEDNDGDDDDDVGDTDMGDDDDSDEMGGVGGVVGGGGVDQGETLSSSNPSLDTHTSTSHRIVPDYW